jgi:hypothetical protein
MATESQLSVDESTSGSATPLAAFLSGGKKIPKNVPTNSEGVLLDIATNATLIEVRDAIKAMLDVEESIWYDATVNSPVYYVRRAIVNEGTGAVTIGWFTLAGAAATPTVANLQAVSNDKEIDQQQIIYVATAAGTGYSINDILVRSWGVATKTAAPAIAYSFWLNATTGTVLSAAPTAGSFSQQTQLISSADLSSINAKLPSALINGALSTNLTSYTYTSSTLNSSTVQLAAGANFPGSVETAFNQPAVQIMVVADQPIRVVLEQYIDSAGTKLVRTSSFTRLASEQLNENIQINANYFRVRVFNLGAATTTTFELNTTYGPLPPLPTELTNQGSLKVQQQKKATYAVTTAAFTPAATATDLLTITAAANKTIKIHSIKCNGTATAATNIDLFLIKRSAQNTAGTFTAQTKVPFNSASAASAATINLYTANPTALGTAVGTITRRKVFLPLAATVIEPINELIEQNTDDSDFITLTGATEMLAINFAAAVVPAGTNIYFTIKYTEES